MTAVLREAIARRQEAERLTPFPLISIAECGLAYIGHEPHEAQRCALIRALYERGDYLSFHFSPGTADYRLGESLRRAASSLKIRPWEFYDRSPEGWGWKIAGFVPGPDIG